MSLLRYASAEKANIAAARKDAIRRSAMMASLARRKAVATADALADTAAANKAIVVDPPVLATDTGQPGQIAFDASFFYVCISEDVWLRAAIATW